MTDKESADTDDDADDGADADGDDHHTCDSRWNRSISNSRCIANKGQSLTIAASGLQSSWL